MKFYKKTKAAAVQRRKKGRESEKLPMRPGPAAAADQCDFDNTAFPNLSLYKLPSKHFRDPPAAMATPPTKTLASVPFQWEEAPGKPRSSSSHSLTTPTKNNKSSSNSARRLELPPRLLFINNNNIDSSSSSSSKLGRNVSYSLTTVLDGPYDSYSGAAGRSFSQHQNSRFSFRSLEEEMIREAKYRHSKSAGITKDKDTPWSFASESFGFPSSASFTSSNFKPPRFKRRSSFASFSQASSNLLTSIYGSLKQVVHWRSRQDQNKI